MATIGQDYLTLADQAKRLDPGGAIATVIEVLSKKNPIIQDAMAIEGNLPTGHRTTLRTGLPDVYWRMINRGVPSSKSRTIQIDEAAGMLEANSVVDKALAKLSRNPKQFRWLEDQAFIQAMNNEVQRAVFYENTKQNPERILGLAPRYADSSAENGRNIIRKSFAGSTGTSIWFVTWGNNTCHLFYPKGTKAGLTVEDKGEQWVTDPDGHRFWAYVTWFEWKLGLALRDWRYVARVQFDASSMPSDLLDMMIDAYTALEEVQDSTRIYMNRKTAAWFFKKAQDKASNQLTLDDTYSKRPVLSFMGIPIRLTDGLLDTESAVA